MKYKIIQEAAFEKLDFGKTRWAALQRAIPAIVAVIPGEGFQLRSDCKKYISKIPECQDDVIRINTAIKEGLS